MDVDSNLETIGKNFVYKYYTVLSTCPQNLKVYYDKYSIFVLRVSTTEIMTVVGKKNIHKCIEQMRFKECNANMLSVNTQKLENYIMTSVVGEMTKCNDSKKKFTQTIVFGYNEKNEYIIKTDMSFYTDAIRQNCVGGNGKTFTCKLKNEIYKNVSASSQNNKLLYPPVSHQLFVSGIPANVKPQDLRQFFEQYGQLHSMRIMKKNDNYGFITFYDSEIAKKVLQDRPIMFPDESGEWLVVKKKRKTSKNIITNFSTSHQLFIGDIPSDVTTNDLKSFFNKWGKVANARIMHAKDYSEHNAEFVHGFVTFETQQGAREVLKNKPIIFPYENGVELKVVEKLQKPCKSRCVKHKKSKKNNKTIFVYF